MSESVCTACGHHIDPSARLCPYCGADPRTGEKVIDTFYVTDHTGLLVQHNKYFPTGET